MRQLTALDAQFLSVESATTATHVAGVAILDPSASPSGALTREALLALLRERLHLAPPLRMRLADVPFGLDRPYWLDDPDVDLDAHVHETTLPAPGGERELAAYVADVHARRLDRGRPLWEAHLVHGLDGGRCALYIKVHHCAIDGVSGSEILTALLDPSPQPRRVEVPPAPASPQPPGLLAMLAGAITRSIVQPVETLCSLARAAADLDAIPVVAALPDARLVAQAARALAGDARPLPETPPLVAPRTPFNGPISGQREIALGSVPLSEVRRVARAFGMGPNDVVMTLCASALRRWLLAHDALPDRPLVAAVPVALRSQRSPDVGGTSRDIVDGRVGNRISAMITPLATDVASPGSAWPPSARRWPSRSGASPSPTAPGWTTCARWCRVPSRRWPRRWCSASRGSRARASTSSCRTCRAPACRCTCAAPGCSPTTRCLWSPTPPGGSASPARRTTGGWTSASSPARPGCPTSGA
ncbi:hypothetical protein GCM10027612_62860 [Microbispora bryophytorum subsp. camponoti]